jgi:lipopolysaccharide/colanic/teichoic acid biosynthesis glycosyltransferase
MNEYKGKRTFDLIVLVLLAIITMPYMILTAILVKSTSVGPILFTQKRRGKNGKTFLMYKFRTMVKDADTLKETYRHLNEAEDPLFKIQNDPRFTKIGKFLSHTGLDELPQLINVLRGEMSIIGPRPLPLEEARNLGKLQQIREKVRPGITSTWITSGYHQLRSSQRIRMDIEYVQNANFLLDVKVIMLTVRLVFRNLSRSIADKTK